LVSKERQIMTASLITQQNQCTNNQRPYTGDSRSSQFRKRKAEDQRAETMKGSPGIDFFFPRAATSEPTSSKPASPEQMSLDEAIEKLESEVKIGKSRKHNQGAHLYQSTQLATLLVYFRRLADGELKMAVSMALAKFPFDGEYMARQIRKWGREYLLNGKLAPHRQGANAKIAPMIENEAFASKCQTWLKDCKPEKRGPLALKKFIEESVFPTLPKPEKAPISDTSRPPKPERITISETTCREYLKKWGYCFLAHKKDVYMDGHERADVVEARLGWVSRMLELEKRMSIFEGENLTETPCDRGQRKKMVQVTHDECAFHAHDSQEMVWLCEGEQLLRKKGDGRAYMVSGFLCACHGVVSLKFLAPGKNADGYWTSDDMVLHVSCFVERQDFEQV